ncbi:MULTISPECIES: PilT/PilU family type 4a pilus ATPase [Methylomonas]|uniref:Type IV pili twitching motility protein PilT n=1 Tax=Methylomonas koyamae TaxID=702114 RepID=A0A291IQL6_9GAMM|nr:MULTISPECIES: PilT/PilU family type 4a pilus ATPase [Methylomonas]ANE57503.1 type IV pili twitching motility protein PilT [Methylomonas sp. DH-1]ATG92467.1 twitching motility protein PilU [Methylomonas koyamae]OAI25567.1 type IV pili twitching motility protein PilT [Methylomonas koyamae]WNB75962.1 PilT/PilU family type 4a pilus ATPase [Methylomonas koyamae]
MDFTALLALMVEKRASDLFITAGRPPSMKVNGKVVEVSKTPLTSDQTMKLVLGIMSQRQRDEFENTKECQFALSAHSLGRFRVSAFTQRDSAGMVLRRIETTIPTAEELHLPPVLKELIMHKRGLVMFVGATGTGKSTSLAALIRHRNENSSGHIISIEDPIEFIHPHQGCIITQREVGLDTESFEVALKNTLRQAPDVILIGEVRTRETMQHAITFAETGHLCVCTLHANNANQALDRILHFFPEDMHSQLFMDLSLNLRGIVAQQLIQRADGKGRYPAIEILLNTPLVADLVRKGEVHKLKELMKNSREHGMQTFDQALYDLYTAGKISYEDALHAADSRNEVRLMIKLGAENVNFETAGMSLAENDEDGGSLYK